jgi:ATP-dependent DNA ligase/intein/homing endonuclease
MEFGEFADAAAEIEALSADTEIIQRVTTLFEESNDDLPVLARFVQGRVFPAWSSRTLDIGPNYCYEAIARAAGTNVSAADVEDRLADVGDIGEVAASYDFGGQQGLGAFASGGSGDGGSGGNDLTVAEVADELDALADAEGSGSQDKKIDILFGLFNRASAEEARYLARIVLSEMRIGVGEGTVRDATAQAFDVPVESVERALQVSNDYGEVARVAREDGEDGLDAMDLELGRPVQAMLAQAGTVSDALDDWEEVAVEWKYDGARCISGYTPIYVNGRGATVVRDIEVGDEVLTHRGRFRQVTAKNRRTIDSDERIFEFSTYFGEDFKITEGHELLVERESERRWTPVEDVSEGEMVVFPIPKPDIPAKHQDELVLETVSNYTKRFELNERFFRFLGYWIGDGTTNQYNGNQRVGLIFNNEDQELLEFYRNLVIDSLGISPENIHKYDHGSATDIYWTDKPLLNWLAENFRKQDQDGWRDKTVPEWFWNISRSQFDAFLEGWHDADGTEDSRGRKSITTKERDLASTVQLIALQFDQVLGIRRVRKSGKTYYRLTLAKSDRHATIKEDAVAVRVLKKNELSRRNPREVDPRQKVYNLQVEDDESYCTPLMAMHNCQIHYDPDGLGWASEEADSETTLGESAPDTDEDAREVAVFSRNMEDVTDALPEVVEHAEEHLDAPAILDGEVVATEDGDPLPFQEVLRRFRRKHDVERAREEVELDVFAFDCLHAAGDDLLRAPLAERHDRLEAVLAEGVSDLWITDDPEEIASIEAEALDAGHEGIMLKNPESTYSPGRRGKNWLKRKPDVETLDLVVTGAEWGEGRRASFLGTFLLSARSGSGTGGENGTGGGDETGGESGTTDETGGESGTSDEAGGETSGGGEYETIGKVATGITDEELADLTDLLEPYIRTQDGQDVDIAPEVVFEVGYEEIQESPTYSSGYALRFPRFVGVREDLDPDDADSLERVERLADQQ